MALVPRISYVVEEIELQVYQTIFSLRTKFLLRDQTLLAKSGQSAQSLLKPTGSPSPWPPIPRSTLEAPSVNEGSEARAGSFRICRWQFCGHDGPIELCNSRAVRSPAWSQTYRFCEGYV